MSGIIHSYYTQMFSRDISRKNPVYRPESISDIRRRAGDGFNDEAASEEDTADNLSDGKERILRDTS